MPFRRDSDSTASMRGLNRREVIRLGALGAGGLMIRPISATGSMTHRTEATMLDFHDRPMDVVRIGFVGVGLQGTSHVENFLKIDGVEIVAICDIVDDRVARAQQLVVDTGQKKPKGYRRGPRDFERLCDRSDLDLVFCSTPWEWHVPVCAAAMENGKHAATEVPMALTVEDCWRLVEISERTRRHCVMMENCNTSSPRPYSRDYLIQGTRGLARKYPEPRIYIEGRSDPHRWDPVEEYLEEYDHPVWRRLEAASAGAGHGGMDFIEDFRLVESLSKGRPVDMDVYDGAMMSAVVELSGRSIEKGGEPLAFPDFTRGGWKSARPLEIMRNERA